MRFLFELGNLDRLPSLLTEIRGIEGVFEATRMMPSLNTSKKKRGHGR
jgi:hypothetical protein